jgi:hypothetical protein
MFILKLDELPEALRADFVADELDGVKGFQHKTTVALRNSMRNAKTERDSYKTKFDAIETRLTDFEKTKADEIEAARAEAMAKAITDGDAKAVELRYQQQMDDLKTRNQADSEAQKSKYDALVASNKKTQKNSIISELVTEMANEKSAKALKALLSGRIDTNPETGEAIFLDEKGGATSLDTAGFKLEIIADGMYDSLLKSGIVTEGGGGLNGGGDGATTTKKFEELSGAELSAIRKKNPAEYERLKAAYKPN